MSMEARGRSRSRRTPSASRSPRNWSTPRGIHMKANTRLARIRENNRNVATIRAFPFPQKMRTQLVIDQIDGILSALTQYSSKVYTPSSWFDFNPALGGPSFGGFGTYAAMYGRYRVLAFKYTLSIQNLENFSVLVSTQSIGTSGTPASGTAFDATEIAMENEYGKYRLLAPKGSGGDGCILKAFVRTSKLWGTPEVLTDNDWAGSSTTSPATNSWIRIGANMINGTALTVGCQYVLKCKSYGYWDQVVNKTS